MKKLILVLFLLALTSCSGSWYLSEPVYYPYYPYYRYMWDLPNNYYWNMQPNYYRYYDNNIRYYYYVPKEKATTPTIKPNNSFPSRRESTPSNNQPSRRNNNS